MIEYTATEEEWWWFPSVTICCTIRSTSNKWVSGSAKTYTTLVVGPNRSSFDEKKFHERNRCWSNRQYRYCRVVVVVAGGVEQEPRRRMLVRRRERLLLLSATKHPIHRCSSSLFDRIVPRMQFV